MAGEIRKLAELMKQSTTQINETVLLIQQHAGEAFTSMEEGTRVVDHFE